MKKIIRKRAHIRKAEKAELFQKEGWQAFGTCMGSFR